jgi:hydroxymethylbilane synthase
VQQTGRRSSALGSANLSDVTVISSEQMLPAACQGIIAVTVRQGDERVSNFLATITDRLSWAVAQAERAFLEALDGSCRTPIGPAARGRALFGGNGRPTGRVLSDQTMAARHDAGPCRTWHRTWQIAAGDLVGQLLAFDTLKPILIEGEAVGMMATR